MSGALTLAGAVIADALGGDPHWLPHPVRAIGAACALGERAARAYARGEPRREAVAGAALASAIVAFAFVVPARALAAAGPRRRALAIALGWTTLAARDLLCEAGGVLAALDAGDLPRARVRVARIVGRDTAGLDAAEIARATIETLAESTCDGIVAPLCALALGGVPLAFAFKAISTLDSTIGHVEAPYTHLGRFAARLDDAACFVPARLTALAICAVAPLVSETKAFDVAAAARAWTAFRRDGRRHASPNAGCGEAALAGALGVRLGGRNVYAGVVRETPFLAAASRPPRAADVRRARLAVALVTALTACAAVAARALADAR